MTTTPTEGSLLPPQESSGGEPGSTRAMDRNLDSAASSAKQVDQASSGQDESENLLALESQQSQPSFTSAGQAEDVSGNGEQKSQNDRSQQDDAKEDEKNSDIEMGAAGSTNLAKGSMDEPSMPYPKRPTLSSFKTLEKKEEGGRGPETRGLDGKTPSDTKRFVTRQKDLTKVHKDVLSDYSPWAGNHTEDRTTEPVIKGGYQIKQQVLNENNTARPTLGPHLKNSTGLQNLSLFFASILQKRHEAGKVVAPSTFKPPPRVTLTDTKREAWLGDLANPAVPLRKLSRTIPHGIRGKVLLDQCMAKNVPMTRAIWLAKCVGANELRAFRRKGVSGPIMVENEQKWIKDWTILLEAFIDDIGRISIQPDWKSRITYTLRLISRIFAEGLLDKDHFVDWTLTKFESAAFDMVPFTLLLVQIVRPGITQSLKHGRRLSTIALSKLHELSTSPDSDLFKPLMNRIVHLLTTLALQHPLCVIVQRVWQHCRSTFYSIIQEYEQASATVLDDFQRTAKRDTANALRCVMEKNDSIDRATARVVSQEEIPQLKLVRALDSFQPQKSIEQIASKCLTVMPQIGPLIKMLLQWATSLYREGLYRVFIVERLIRRWNDEGHDTNTYILDALDDLRHSNGLNPRKMSRLIADLIQSGHFDTARFLRSLVSSGGLYDKDRPYDLQILVDMPLLHLQPNVLGLRSMLIRGHGSSDPRRSHLAERHITKQFESFLTVGDNGEYYTSDLKVTPSELTWSEVFEITEFIRGSLHFLESQNHTTRDHETAVENTTSNVFSTATHAKRMVKALETVENITAIPDILYTIVPVADMECLVCMMEAIEINFEDLAATGAVESLFQNVSLRYRTLRATQPPMKRLVVPMYDICTRLPAFNVMITYLKRELASCNANLGIAANTPVSDIQVDTTNESDNELERILVGGAIMDFQRLSQAFEIVLSRIAKATKFDQYYSTLVGILGTLKGQNEATFRDVLAFWLRSEISKAKTVALARAVSCLFRAGCFDPSSFAAMAERICDDLASEDVDAGIASSVKVLDLFLVDSQSDASPFDSRILAETIIQICEVNAELVLRLFVRALRANENSSITMAVETVCQSKLLIGLLRRIIVDKPTAVTSILEPGAMLDNSVGLGRLKHVVASLADPSGQLRFLELSDSEQARVMFETVDGFSLPFYELCLRSIRFETPGSQIPNAFLETVVKREAQGCRLWPSLISAVDLKVALQVRTSAEEHVLMDSSTPEEALDRLRRASYPDVRIWTRLIKATSFSISEQGEAETGRNIEKNLGLATSIMVGSVHKQDELLQWWLQALCQLTIIHNKSYSGPTMKMKITHTLCGLLARNVGQLNADTLGAVLDTAAYMVEDLSPQAFALVRSNLGPLKNDRRVRFLFGTEENADGWLYAVRASATQPAQVSEQTAPSLFPLRRWELLPESAANIGANDTALSLRLFDATKV